MSANEALGLMFPKGRITPARTATTLDALQSGLPILRPWVPLQQHTSQHGWGWKSSDPNRVRCAAARNETTLKPRRIITCNVYGTMRLPSDRPTRTYQVFQDKIDGRASKQGTKSQGCPVLGPGFLGPAIRMLQLQDEVDGLNLTNPTVASIAGWAWRVEMPLTRFQEALCPVVKRMYLLADVSTFSALYCMLLSMIGKFQSAVWTKQHTGMFWPVRLPVLPCAFYCCILRRPLNMLLALALAGSMIVRCIGPTSCCTPDGTILLYMKRRTNSTASASQTFQQLP